MDARRAAAAEASGRRAVELALEGGPRPSQILTAAAFDNAITLLMALGGSTNAVIHLLALAGRGGIDLELDRFDEISRRTPVLTNVRPAVSIWSSICSTPAACRRAAASWCRCSTPKR